MTNRARFLQHETGGRERNSYGLFLNHNDFFNSGGRIYEGAANYGNDPIDSRTIAGKAERLHSRGYTNDHDDAKKYWGEWAGDCEIARRARGASF